jgi:pyridoxamine 5'-phosphate oxidase
MSLADIRREYAAAVLEETHVDPDPIAQFRRWFDEAMRARVMEPTAATLATASREGAPSARIVLIKGVDARGFAFYTDYRSRKGRDLAENPRAALCVYWSELERQVRIEGHVERVSTAESREYFISRPLGSRIGAWASFQSSEIAGRAELEARVRSLERELGDDPELPPHWGGYVLAPSSVEFWQGRESRLHDRLEYLRAPHGWTLRRLSP